MRHFFSPALNIAILCLHTVIILDVDIICLPATAIAFIIRKL